MSFVAHGLKCSSCDYREDHVFYKRSDGPPACPDCGGSRSVSWSHGKFPGVKGGGLKSFKKVDLGAFGVCETQDQYDRAMGAIQSRFPGKQILVESDSATDKRTRADEARHRQWASRKEKGLNNKMVAEMKAEAKAVKKTLKKGEKVHVSSAGTKITQAGQSNG